MDPRKTPSLAETLQRSVLNVAGVGNSGGVTIIAALMQEDQAAETWKANEMLWKMAALSRHRGNRSPFSEQSWPPTVHGLDFP